MLYSAQLERIGEGSFRGYRIETIYKLKAADANSPVKADKRSTGITDDGKFAIELPEPAELTGDIEIRVFSPQGELRASIIETVANFPGAARGPIKIKPVAPLPPGAGHVPGEVFRRTLSGMLIDESGTNRAANRTITFYARREGAEADVFIIVLTAKTGRGGVFTGPYPKGKFESAFAMVQGVKDKLRIDLTDKMFPIYVLLALPEAPADKPAPPPTKTQPCECDSHIPRAPDPEVLAAPTGTFSEDLGGGRCVDLTIPNRTLEEFNYHVIVRTTMPEIQGMTQGPKPKPSKIVTSIVDKLRNLNTKRDSLAASLITGTAVARPLAKPSWPFSLFGRDEAATTTKEATAVEPDLSDLEIDANDLVSALRDGDGLRAASLLDAGQLTLRNEILDLLRNTRHTSATRSELNAQNPVDWDLDPTFYQATSVAFGHLLQFKQQWKADGYSLGDLLYSLPLGPLQRRRVAIVDWERREAATRTEDLQASDQMEAQIAQDRDVNEIVTGVLKESMHGGSTTTTSAIGGGAGGGMLGVIPAGEVPLPFGVLAGVAGGTATSDSDAWQNASRTMTTESMQRISDLTQQQASSVRSQRSTVVQSFSQNETTRAETEIVANYNHCHSMSLEYFQVLRHFLVTQELVSVQECVFVPLLMSWFDIDKALRWRDILAGHLQHRQLIPAFNAAYRWKTNWADTDFPAARYADENVEFIEGELQLRVSISLPSKRDDKKEMAEYLAEQWSFYAPITGMGAQGILEGPLAGSNYNTKTFEKSVAPRIAQELLNQLTIGLQGADGHLTQIAADLTVLSTYRSGGLHQVRFRSRAMPGITRAQIEALVVAVPAEIFLPSDSIVRLESARARYRTTHYSGVLAPQYTVRDDLMRGDPAVVYTPLNQDEMRNPRHDDKVLTKRLLQHLNEKLEYYHRAIWWRMDAERRFMMLDGFEAPGAGGRSLASVVENRLIGIVGNSLVLPVSPGNHLDPTYAGQLKDANALLRHYTPELPPPAMRLTLPTRGVFLEAINGSCNSCEQKDESRFWRFEESPPPEELTAIGEVSTATRQTPPPDLTPQPFAAPIINMQSGSPLPDPAGVNALVAALTKGDAFRDITGLTENQRNAIAALKSAFETSQFFGGKAAELTALAAQTMQNSKNYDSQMKNIKQAQVDNLITDEEAGQFTRDLLRSTTGADSRLPDVKQIKELKDAGLISEDEARRLTNRIMEARIGDTSTAPLIDAAGEMVRSNKSNDQFDVSVSKGGDVRVASTGNSKSGKTGKEKGELISALESALDIASQALASGLAKARKDPEGKLAEALQESLKEAARKELLDAGANFAESVPLGKALKVSIELALAFAAGAGAELQRLNERLRAHYEQLEKNTVSDADGLTEEQIEMLGKLRSYQLQAVQEMPRIMEEGLKNMALVARDMLIEQAGKVFTENLRVIASTVAQNEEIVAIFASGIEQGRAQIPASLRALEEKILTILVKGYIKQLDEGRLRTALENVIKPVKGDNPIIVELFGGVLFALMELEKEELKDKLGGAFPEVKAALMKKAVTLKAEYDANGLLRIIVSGNTVKTEANKLTVRAALMAEVQVAAGNPPEESFRVVALVESFLALKDIEQRRLNAVANKLQRSATTPGMLESAKDQIYIENTRSIAAIANGYNNLLKQVKGELGLPDDAAAEQFITAVLGYRLDDRMTSYRIDVAGLVDRSGSARALKEEFGIWL
jgi:hypothetical protein